MPFDYDLFVIGAGSGGAAGARTAAQYGIRVGVAEQEALGGTCLNRGCIPKKFIVYAADFALKNRMAHDYGWSGSKKHFSWLRFINSVHQQIKSIHESYQESLQKAGIEIFRGHAKFVDEHTIELNGRNITAERFLIAVGAQPIKPDIPGIEYAITYRQIFKLPHLPKRLAIIGGGYIEVEFASMMNAFGCEVTVIDTSETILSGFDHDIRRHVQDGLSNRGIRFIGNSSAKAIKFCEDNLLLTIAGDSQKIMTADSVLIATPRVPETKNLGLENAGVKLGEKQEILVDEYSCTTQENIYAVGDCTNRLQLTPVAKAQAKAFVKTVFGKQPQTVNYEYVPSAVFTRPEAASVGMSEEKAREKFGDSIECYQTKFQPLISQLTIKDEQALMKLVVEKDSAQVLGAHMVGEHAADIIQSLAVAIRKGITKQEIDDTIAIHPTTAEEFLRLH